MGTYTNLYLRVPILSDHAPSEIVSDLQNISKGRFPCQAPPQKRAIGQDDNCFLDSDWAVASDHELFKLPFYDWWKVFWGQNCDEDNFGTKYDGKMLEIRSEFKNYDGQIDLVLDWLKPAVCTRKKVLWIGFRKREDFHPKINLYRHQDQSINDFKTWENHSISGRHTP